MERGEHEPRTEQREGPPTPEAGEEGGRTERVASGARPAGDQGAEPAAQPAGDERQAPQGPPRGPADGASSTAVAPQGGAHQGSPPSQAGDESGRSEPLLAAREAEQFRHRWEIIQTGFVDEPRRSVEEADTLVDEVIRRLADTFSEERSALEGQWSRGGEVATDDLRLALQRYRSFFRRLLET